MPFGTRILIALLSLLCISNLGASMAQSETWTVKLTKEQAKKARETIGLDFTTAVAISPDGAWGRSWRARTLADEKERALGYCRAHLKPKRRDCFLYMVNGKVVAPKTVETRVVSVVYKPVDGKKAPAVLGRARVNFVGDKSAALADFKKFKTDSAHFKRLSRDRALEAALKRQSFMNTKKSGFAIWFESTGGQQHMAANGGKILKMRFSDWRATSDGLVCMIGAVWSSGKAVENRCLIIESIKDGVADFYWAGKNTRYQGQIIAGNALHGAVR